MAAVPTSTAFPALSSTPTHFHLLREQLSWADRRSDGKTPNTHLGCLHGQLLASGEELRCRVGLVGEHEELPLSLVRHPVPVLEVILVIQDKMEEKYFKLLRLIGGDEPLVGEASTREILLTSLSVASSSRSAWGTRTAPPSAAPP